MYPKIFINNLYNDRTHLSRVVSKENKTNKHPAIVELKFDWVKWKISEKLNFPSSNTHSEEIKRDNVGVPGGSELLGNKGI